MRPNFFDARSFLPTLNHRAHHRAAYPADIYLDRLTDLVPLMVNCR